MDTLVLGAGAALRAQVTAGGGDVHVPPPGSQLSPLGDEKTQELVQLFKLLADETRLRIIHFLTGQPELNVCSLCRLLKQSQPAVSHHLALLRTGGIIEYRRDGKHNFYRLSTSRLMPTLESMIGGARQ